MGGDLRWKDNGILPLSDFYHGLTMPSVQNDCPMDKDAYNRICRVRANSFDTDFHVQAKAAKEWYRTKLKFSFVRHDILPVLDSIG